jgi:hypothetical protein
MAAGATQRVESAANVAYLADACAALFPGETVGIRSLLEDTPYPLIVEYVLSGRLVRKAYGPSTSS